MIHKIPQLEMSTFMLEAIVFGRKYPKKSRYSYVYAAIQSNIVGPYIIIYANA